MNRRPTGRRIARVAPLLPLGLAAALVACETELPTAAEIEALMDEEIQTIRADKLKAYHALTVMGDGFPAIGIVAAVLGVVKAMGALDQSPEILGGLIGAALVGTFLGILLAYGFFQPIATALEHRVEEELQMEHCIKAGILAVHKGFAPAIAF